MFFVSRLSGVDRGKMPGQSRSTTSRFQPRLEALEDRCLPSTINVWVAPGPSGNWNISMNWSFTSEKMNEGQRKLVQFPASRIGELGCLSAPSSPGG
jgi:hypothetical protein